MSQKCSHCKRPVRVKGNVLRIRIAVYQGKFLLRKKIMHMNCYRGVVENATDDIIKAQMKVINKLKEQIYVNCGKQCNKAYYPMCENCTIKIDSK